MDGKDGGGGNTGTHVVHMVALDETKNEYVACTHEDTNRDRTLR